MYRRTIEQLEAIAEETNNIKIKNVISDFMINPNHIDDNQLTPLMRAFDMKNKQLMKFFVLAGADCNFLVEEGKTGFKLFNHIKSSQDEDMVRFTKKLISFQTGKNMHLFLAVKHNDIKLAQQMLKSGAFVDFRNKINETPLILACAKGNLNMVKMLVRCGANVNVRDSLKATPLMWASYGNDIEIAKYLIDMGADVNAYDNLGCTPLMWWATNSKDNVKAIKMLLDVGADPKVLDKNKFLPWLNKGLNDVLSNKSNLSALDYAKDAFNTGIASYLESLD